MRNGAGGGIFSVHKIYMVSKSIVYLGRLDGKRSRTSFSNFVELTLEQLEKKFYTVFITCLFPGYDVDYL